MREHPRAQLCPAQGWTSPVGSSDAFSSHLFRRECGTAPQGVQRPKRADLTSRKLVCEDAWFIEDDNWDEANCGSPTLVLVDPPASGSQRRKGFVDDDTPQSDRERPLGSLFAGSHEGEEFEFRPARWIYSRPPERGGQRSSPQMNGLEADSHSRIEGGVDISPRAERLVYSQHSPALKGLLNSSQLEQRLSGEHDQSSSYPASAVRTGSGSHLNPAYNLRLQIPKLSEGENDKYEEMLRERPPSRQRNLPMHLNSDISLEMTAKEGQVATEKERKWAHYSTTPRPLSRHKSPPEASIPAQRAGHSPHMNEEAAPSSALDKAGGFTAPASAEVNRRNISKSTCSEMEVGNRDFSSGSSGGPRKSQHSANLVRGRGDSASKEEAAPSPCRRKSASDIPI
ncbi:MAG: hypothetical protein SGPRY_011203, partial [Prymnesium sp.]